MHLFCFTYKINTKILEDIYFTFKCITLLSKVAFTNADVVKAVIKLFAGPIILILAKIKSIVCITT